MRASAILIAIGVALVVLQLFWPLRLDAVSWISVGPAVAGLVLVTIGLLVGMARGTRMYRSGVGLAVLGIVVFFYGLGTRFYGRPGPIPSPTLNEVFMLAGLGICALAAVIAVLALVRPPRSP